MVYLKRKLPQPQSAEGGMNKSNSNINNHSSSSSLSKRPRLLCHRGPGLGNRLGSGLVPSSSSNNNNNNDNNNNSDSIQRAPFFIGNQVPTNSSLTTRKFQRPMLKRRAYGKHADTALQQASLGPKRRFDGMAKLLARAGRGLTYQLPQTAAAASGDTDGSSSDGSDTDNEGDNAKKDPDRPLVPLRVWKTPHPRTDNGPAPDDFNEDQDEEEQDDEEPLERKGLPPRMTKITRPDEYGVEEEVTILQPAPISAYARSDVFVPPILAKWLRPHQRKGVSFMYKCVMGLKDYHGKGCILADDMGLGKTLQSVTLIYTLLKTGITADGQPTAKRVIVVCPCSLVKNWENEFVKWLGPGVVKTLALAEADRKTVEKNMDCFAKTKLFNILICSYECLRTHVKRLTKVKDCCDLLVCDEAHRLKNADNQTSRALNSLPVARRVLLTGTPMQNDLGEFYAMVDFANPGILGTNEQFRKNMLFPILRGREPDASDAERAKMLEKQNHLSSIVNHFILRRVNTLNAQHLPPKLVQVVCCNLTDIQQNMYQHLISSKDMQHVLEGKQTNCLASIQLLMKLCNHPTLIANEDPSYGPQAMVKANKRSAAQNKSYVDEDNVPSTAAPGADGVAKFLPQVGGGGRGNMAPVYPEWSGKMFVLYRLMREMRKPGNGGDKIVIVSNYTQTLDLIGRMCRENSWGFCRLDGSITMKKRQKMVDEFNDPSSSLVAFLLSSKAGGCGLNLIGGNRLVLFDPDWNPAVDKQAAARCWRDGQTKRCFTYRLLATGTVEEKIFQRQLSKEGLQSVVDDKEQVNALSTKDLRNLFKLRTGTPSDTHDKLRCERCEICHDNAEAEAKRVLPKQLARCAEILERLRSQPEAAYFLSPLDPTQHDRTKEEYEKLVKQPMDFGTIQASLAKPIDQPSAYKSISAFSKDVNRVFGNVLKVWNPGDDIADAARALQLWWTSEWSNLVPVLMTIKADDDEGEITVTEPRDTDDVLSQSACFNNVRGTDYQEQIGMPEEENMRHWSHHYSTDTVDDPVFRAAMRGCDAVSFVFGLEVTWSLIQQRQQEEEEAQAAKLLEEMQENGDLNSNEGGKSDRKEALASDSDDEQKETESTVSSVDSESDNANLWAGNGAAAEPKDSKSSSMLEPEDVMDDSDEEESAKQAQLPCSSQETETDHSQSTPKTQKRASGEEFLSESDASPVDESPRKSSDVRSVEDSDCSVVQVETATAKRRVTNKTTHTSDVTDSLGAVGGDDSPRGEPEQKWQCSCCTFLNTTARSKCEMCSTHRFPRRRRSSS